MPDTSTVGHALGMEPSLESSKLAQISTDCAQPTALHPVLSVDNGPASPRGAADQPGAAKQDGDRFYCPFPGCNRSFAELWRLKVHYRAPPDVRGSGKERGHGTELLQCPKCGKTLKPGKHHVGCSGVSAASKAASAKSTKRKAAAGCDGPYSASNSVTASAADKAAAGAAAAAVAAAAAPAAPDQDMLSARSPTMLCRSDYMATTQLAHAAVQPGMQTVGSMPLPNMLGAPQMAMAYMRPGSMGNGSMYTPLPMQGHGYSSPLPPPQRSMPPMSYPSHTPGLHPGLHPTAQPPPPLSQGQPPPPYSPHLPPEAAAAAAEAGYGLGPGARAWSCPGTFLDSARHPHQLPPPAPPPRPHPPPDRPSPSSFYAHSEPEFLASIFDDVPEFTAMAPSPPPLPSDFHINSLPAPNRMLFNFGQFSQKMPHALAPGVAARELSDREVLDLAEQHVVYDHTDDGELMQMLFGMADDVPTMATIHLHTGHNVDEEGGEGGMARAGQLAGAGAGGGGEGRGQEAGGRDRLEGQQGWPASFGNPGQQQGEGLGGAPGGLRPPGSGLPPPRHQSLPLLPPPPRGWQGQGQQGEQKAHDQGQQLGHPQGQQQGGQQLGGQQLGEQQQRAQQQQAQQQQQEQQQQAEQQQGRPTGQGFTNSGGGGSHLRNGAADLASSTHPLYGQQQQQQPQQQYFQQHQQQLHQQRQQQQQQYQQQQSLPQPPPQQQESAGGGSGSRHPVKTAAWHLHNSPEPYTSNEMKPEPGEGSDPAARCRLSGSKSHLDIMGLCGDEREHLLDTDTLQFMQSVE